MNTNPFSTMFFVIDSEYEVVEGPFYSFSEAVDVCDGNAVASAQWLMDKEEFDYNEEVRAGVYD